uniref:ionotropic receptor 160 n=1 Tax=Aedes aegypti TaxID=7159 RepID=UPI000C238650|nr:ionotropic receptor 160 [Aedes aegypti]
MHPVVLVSLVQVFGCFHHQLSNPTELCIATPPQSDLQWLDILDGILPAMSCPQRMVSTQTTGTVSRSCKLVLFPLTGHSTTKILQHIILENSAVRFSPFIFFGFKCQLKFSLSTYQMLLKQFRLMRSLLVELSEGRERVFKFNFLTDQLDEVSWKDLSELPNVDIVKNTHGYPFLCELQHSVNVLFAPFQLLVHTFAEHVNASLRLLPNPWIKMPLNWYTDNNIELRVRHIVMENLGNLHIVVDHEFDGLCLLIPEQYLKPYILYLNVPFQTHLWILTAFLVIFFNTFKQLKKFFLQTHGRKVKILVQMILISATWIEFVLCEVYVVKLVSFILSVKRVPHLRSIEEFNRSALSIYVMDDPELRTSAQQYFSVDRLVFGTKNTFSIYPLETNTTYIINCNIAQVIAAIPWNWDPNTSMRKFYMLPERIHWFMSTTAFIPMSPMFQKYKLVSNWVFELGLWNNWESKLLSSYGRLPERKCYTLEFDDLVSMFWLLIFSGVVGLAIVWIECAVAQFSK